MSGILSQIGTELVLGLVGTVVGSIWTAFKSLDFMQSRRAERYDEAVRALESGVEKTYEVYVRHIKEARADGKLTSRERRAARDRAVRYAVDCARDRGVDLVETLGRDYLPVLITRIVRELKGTKGTGATVEEGSS